MQKSCESRVPIHDRQRESAVRIRQTASAGACVRTTVGAVTNLNSSSGRLRGRQFVDVGCGLDPVSWTVVDLILKSD
jgi:hypothetical protein